ncbi:hypothetical protein ISCGN_019352 [Ixodes scapularis]
MREASSVEHRASESRTKKFGYLGIKFVYTSGRGPRFLFTSDESLPHLSFWMNQDSSSFLGPHLISLAKVDALTKSNWCPHVHAWSTSSDLKRVAFVELATSRACSFSLVILFRPVSPM